jgi:hypothetical protein
MKPTIFKSRKFWLAVLDLVITLALYFTSKYAPMAAEDVKIVILAIQPVFVTLIAGIAAEDAAALKSGIYPKL